MTTRPLAEDDHHAIVPTPEPPAHRYLARAHDGAVVGVVYATARGYRLWRDGEPRHVPTLAAVLCALR